MLSTPAVVLDSPDPQVPHRRFTHPSRPAARHTLMKSAARDSYYGELRHVLAARPRTWLITGVAGFIGSNLLEELLALGQNVIGLDNFSTGYQANIDDVMALTASRRGTFRLIRGDIRDLQTCREACKSVDFVLHHAAIGSVPRSIDDPLTSNSVNVDGFLNVLVAAHDAGVHRVVYASTCAVYGDSPTLPLSEESDGGLLSPYAASKLTNEIYASVFQHVYGLQLTGLRYFNIFGPRQDPNGDYAAVIPRWISNLIDGERCEIHGDGETSRDFCFIANVTQAVLLAALSDRISENAEVYNVACGNETTLNELFRMIRLGLVGYQPSMAASFPVYGPCREGDIRRSGADITKIRQHLEYEPTHTIAQGLSQTLEWYVEHSPKGAMEADAAPVAALG